MVVRDMKGCCEEYNLCAFHTKYPTLFYYKCLKCQKYYGSSDMNGEEITLKTKHGSAPKPTGDNAWVLTECVCEGECSHPTKDGMNIFLAVCGKCHKMLLNGLLKKEKEAKRNLEALEEIL